MIEIGKFNLLKIIKQQNKEFVLEDNPSAMVLLPVTDAPKESKIGDSLKVFIYVDGKGNLLATMKTPLAQVDDVAWLKCISTSHAGAFLDWGVAKDILLPFSEQTQKISEGSSYLVKIFVDESNRIAASMLLDDFLEDEAFYFKQGQTVDLIVADETDLGVKAIINNQYWGVLYNNEIFQKLNKGQKIKGYIKKIRDDNKIDLVLQIAKYASKVDSVTDKILARLKSQNGVLLINDKSPPEVIYSAFGVSKKVFKQAIGTLYKKRIISIDKQGISLVDKSE